MKPGVSTEACRTLCPAGASVCAWCGVPVVCVLCVVFGPHRAMLRLTFFLSGAAPRSTKVGSWAGSGGWRRGLLLERARQRTVEQNFDKDGVVFAVEDEVPQLQFIDRVAVEIAQVQFLERVATN